MKNNSPFYQSLFKLAISPAILAVAISSALAQINGSDPTLRFWFKAETLTGTNVPVWMDSSSHGVALAVPEPPAADCHNTNNADGTSHKYVFHTPPLITVTNNGKEFKAVSFRQAFDPVCESHTHYADRLWQTNQLDENDPTLIYPTNDMTMIIVWLNIANDIWIGPGQAIVTKRGGGGANYQFGFSGVDIAPYAFNGSAAYEATQLVAPKGVANQEWGINIMNLTPTNAVWYDYFASKYGWRTQTTPYSPGAEQVGTPLMLAGYAAPGASGLYERAAAYFAEIVMYNRTLSPSELAAIQQELLTKYFVNAGPPVVVAQPQSITVNQYDTATFAVNIDGTPPFQYQWLKGGVPVTAGTGANGPIYTIPIVSPADQGFYTVAVTNGGGYTNSDAAFLTVVPDVTAPTIVSVLLNSADPTQVKVTFSELVNPASATNTAFYSINNGVTISSIDAVPQTNNLSWATHVYSVILNTSGVTVNSKLNVSGSVQDRGGTPIAAVQKDIFVPAIVGEPPTQNLVMWLQAETGVYADVIGVYDWVDQATTSAHINSVFSVTGAPQLGTADFPNAQHPAVRFFGNDSLAFSYPEDFNIANVTIYVVGAVDTNRTCAFIGNYRGYAIENGSGNPTQISWNTVTTAGETALTGGSLQGMVPAFIQATFSPPNKTLSVNGTLVGIQTNAAALDYSTDNRGLCLGALFAGGTTHALVGSISEVLIYSNVDPSRDATIQAYIASKYFAPSPSTPKMVSAAVSTTESTNVTVMFNMGTAASSAGNPANYTLNNGATVLAVTNLNTTTARLTTTPLNPAQAYTLAANVTDWTGVAPSSQIALTFPGSAMRYQDSSAEHLTVVEAEHFSQNTPSGGQTWTAMTNSPWLLPNSVDTNASGGSVMVLLPDVGSSSSFTVSNTPIGIAQLDYKLYFAQAGTNYVWIRGSGNSGTSPLGTSDSINLGLDGIYYYRIDGQWPRSAGYTWSKTPAPVSGVFRVPTPGYHVLNLWVREDGFAVDKIVLTTSSSYIPTGLGPNESSTSPPVDVPRITLTREANGTLTLSWSGGGALQSALTADGTFSDIPGAASGYNVAPSGNAKFFRVRQ